MDLQMMTKSFMDCFWDADFSILLRWDVLFLALAVYLAILRKRGGLHALVFVVLSSMSLVVAYDRMNKTGEQALEAHYFVALLSIGVLVVLYLIYLYTLRPQVE